MSPNSNKAQSLLDEAVAYAARGWPVLPCWWGKDGCCACGAPPDSEGKPTCSAGKHPIGNLAPHGVKDASTDEAVIRAWWGKYPHANVAIATGAVSGLVVLDVDGELGLSNVKGRELPPTVTCKTPRGWHYYFRHPGGRIPNAVGLLPSVDVRADGGYVIAAPSVNVNGVSYAWA